MTIITIITVLSFLDKNIQLTNDPDLLPRIVFDKNNLRYWQKHLEISALLLNIGRVTHGPSQNPGAQIECRLEQMAQQCNTVKELEVLG